MRATHADEKKEMKETQEKAVHRLATIVRDRAEERSVAVELRYHLGSNLLEEVRTDTGEVTTDVRRRRRTSSARASTPRRRFRGPSRRRCGASSSTASS
jgi:hypothetical protein